MNCIEQLIKTTSLIDYPLVQNYDPIRGIDTDAVLEAAFMDEGTSTHTLTLLEIVAMLAGNESNALLSEIHALPETDRAAVLQVLTHYWNPKPVEEDL